MGQIVYTQQARPTLGFVQIAAVAAAGPAAPIAAAIAAGISLFGLVFGLHKKSAAEKVHDTVVLEAAQVAFHEIWAALTGEKLDGIEHIAAPGQYGASRVGLFNPSGYPAVPGGPEGFANVNLDAALAALEQTYRDAAQQMQRRPSVENLTGNYRRMRELFDRVQTARAEQTPPASPPGGPGVAPSLPAWLAPAAIGLALVFVARRVTA